MNVFQSYKKKIYFSDNTSMYVIPRHTAYTYEYVRPTTSYSYSSFGADCESVYKPTRCIKSSAHENTLPALKGYFSHRVVSVKSTVSKVFLCPYCHGNNSENNDVSPAANVLN